MKYLVFSTCGIWQVPAIVEAKKIGLITIAVDANPNAEGFKHADFCIVSELDRRFEILNEIKSITKNIIGAISYCSDAGMYLAEFLNNEFKCSSSTIINSLLFTNKFEQRNIWSEFGILQPKYNLVSSFKEALKAIDLLNLPVVIKPTDSSGSRGVSILNSSKDIQSAFNLAMGVSRSKLIMMEEFMMGTEYTVEVFAHNNKIVPLVVTRKEKIEQNFGTVAAALWTVSPYERNYDLIEKLGVDAFSALGLNNGPGHLELIADENNIPVGVVEAAGRGGGFNLASELIQKATGFNFIENSIAVYTGIEDLCENVNLVYRPSVLFFFPSQNGKLVNIEGLEIVDNIEDVSVCLLAQPGMYFSKAQTDGDRLCTITISADTDIELIQKYNLIKSTLKFIFE